MPRATKDIRKFSGKEFKKGETWQTPETKDSGKKGLKDKKTKKEISGFRVIKMKARNPQSPTDAKWVSYIR